MTESNFSSALHNLVLGGYECAVARDPETRARSWTVTTQPAASDDLAPLREHVGWGAGGMFAPPGAKNGFSYGNDVEVEADILSSGPYQYRAGLALDTTVTVLRATVPTNASAPGTPGTPANWYAAGTVANDSGAGTVAWTNPTNAQGATNTGYATASLGTGATSNWLRATNFSIPLAAGANVIGIRVTVNGKISGATPGDYTVRLVRDGAVVTGAGTPTTTGAVAAGAAADTIVGSTTALLNVTGTLTGSVVSSSTFGVAVSVTNNDAGTQTASVDSITLAVYYGGGTRLVYGASGNVLRKLSLTYSAGVPSLTDLSTKTFTHNPTGAATISDLVFPKAGPSVGGACGVVAFGREAQLQQINAIQADTTVDTYGALNATAAYGGKFTVTPSNQAKETLLWKSQSINASGDTTGALAGLRSKEVDPTTAATVPDLTARATWEPSAPYVVGNLDTDITRLFTFRRGLMVCKPEGLYSFDEGFAPARVLNTESFASPVNGQNARAWLETALIPSSVALMEYPARGADPAVGIETISGNTSGISGRVTALAGYGPWLVAAIYTGTDTWIVKARRRQPGEQTHADLVWRPVTKLASYQCNELLITSDADGEATVLLYACASATSNKHDIGYCVLAGSGTRTLACGGAYVTARMGELDRLTILEQVVVFARGVSGSVYWTVEISWDEGTTWSSVGAVTSNGRNVLNFTRSTNDRGYRFELRFTLTCSGSTSTSVNPRLIGGFDLHGARQADQVEQFECKVETALHQDDGHGGEFLESPDELWTALSALVENGTTSIIYPPHFGDATTGYCIVKSVAYTEQRGDGDAPPPRLIHVVGRMVAN